MSLYKEEAQADAINQHMVGPGVENMVILHRVFQRKKTSYFSSV
ncbi:hypothetical protein BBD26_0133 [Lactobacillus delbrueckii subsp. bulgaricus]|nr:hypothetical protein [Lactobacillus delbrueckii]AQR53361.1 hypothetical protein BBD26_0133 [Lactobacillus delbrueckii subsp. bulgaricus]